MLRTSENDGRSLSWIVFAHQFYMQKCVMKALPKLCITSLLWCRTKEFPGDGSGLSCIIVYQRKPCRASKLEKQTAMANKSRKRYIKHVHSIHRYICWRDLAKRRRVQPSGKVSKLQIWPVLKGWHVLTSLPKSFYVKFLQSCEGNKTFKSERRMYLLMTYLRCIPQSRTIRKNSPVFSKIKLSMRLCLISNPKSDITEFPFQNTQAIQPDLNGAWLSTPAMATPAVRQFWRQLITEKTSNLPNAWRNETILKHLKQLLLHKTWKLSYLIEIWAPDPGSGHWQHDVSPESC